MKNIIAACSFFIMAFCALGLGAPYMRGPADALVDSTGTLNQVANPTSDQGHQDEQWDQEEEELSLTDEERNRIQKQEERRKLEDAEMERYHVEEYRYDVP